MSYSVQVRETGGRTIPRKPARPKFTREELRLLAHPPTEDTWYCRHTQSYSEESGAEVVTDVCNSGNRERCWMCDETKSPTAALAWPIYQEALRKRERQKELSGNVQ